MFQYRNKNGHFTHFYFAVYLGEFDYFKVNLLAAF